MMIYYAVFFAAGLAAGLFLKVCIECLPSEIPVKEGFKKHINLRNPLIELLTAVTFVLLLKRYSLSAEFFAASFLMSILIAAFFIDLKHRIIPNELVLAGLLGSVLLLAYSVFSQEYIFGEKGWWGHLIGLLPGSGILMLVALIGIAIYKTDDAMGMGDVKIFAPIGIILGWKLCMVSVFIAIAAAGLSSLFLIASRKKSRKDAIPFGPFIVIGTFVALIWGQDIIKWYVG